MNKTLLQFGRQTLKDLLKKVTEPQREMFKLMYGRDYGRNTIEVAKAMDINDCVDLMDDNAVDQAIVQCERTIEKNENRSNGVSKL